jgi:hypothetical protein
MPEILAIHSIASLRDVLRRRGVAVPDGGRAN